MKRLVHFNQYRHTSSINNFHLNFENIENENCQPDDQIDEFISTCMYIIILSSIQEISNTESFRT